MKFIIEESFIVATDFLSLTVPPQNKEYEDLAGFTPVHMPTHDAGGTTIASTISLYKEGDPVHTESVTNDFATFNYNSWNSREFTYGL